MMQIVDVQPGVSLDDYEAHGPLTRPVQELRTEARHLVKALDGRRLWMVNSTPQGGGVAEMLPKVVSILRELGVPTDWAVIGTSEERFFDLTKRIHNAVHGAGDPRFDAADREVYEAVNRTNADDFARRLGPEDLVVVHDPQPMALGKMIHDSVGVRTVWRCHIGLDGENAATRAAWDFLAPYTDGYRCAVFSAPEYITGFPPHRASIIHPAIDPLSDKNRPLSSVRLTGVLNNSGLVWDHQPVLTPQFPETAERITPQGEFVPAREADQIGLLFRPVVTQISRWDRLKGFLPLVRAFVRVKRERGTFAGDDELHRRRLDIARLVLAGPDPSSVQDDPEGQEVLQELIAAYRDLPPELHRDVALLSLPMASRRHNALMVNALQRASSVVVQNSLEEGFGLTVTEAMWKSAAILGSSACGIRQQVRDGVDGRLVVDATDEEELAATLNEVMAASRQRSEWGRNAQRRVFDEFLIFTQIAEWLRLLVRVVEGEHATVG